MLFSDNLTLRALTRDDLPQMCAWSNDVEYELLSGGDPPHPQSLADWEKWFDERRTHAGKGDVDFAITVDGQLIGTCGLSHWSATAANCELGIGIGERDYRGRGFGRAAIRLLLDYAFRLRNAHRVYLNTNSNNPRALRAYAACGFVEEGRLRQHEWSGGHYVDAVQMGVLRDEWENNQ